MVDLFNVYQQPIWVMLALLVIAAWTLVWKGLALWSSARNKQKAWFVVILIFNTMGLLPIIYLIWFKSREVKVEKPVANHRITKKTTKLKVTKKKPLKKKTTKRKKKR